MSTTLWQPNSTDNVQPSHAITAQVFNGDMCALHVIDIGGSTPTSALDLTALYQEVDNIDPGSSAVIFSYTVPAGKNAQLRNVQVSGDNISTYRLLIDGDTVMVKRSYYSDFDIVFDLAYGDGGAVKLASGQILSVTANAQGPYAGSYGTTAMMALMAN